MPFEMRTNCRCGGIEGVIRPAGGQDCVYCLDCGKFQYNAPKRETGKEQRSVSTRKGLKPNRRSRILERANGRCEVCGTPCYLSILQIGHVVSVEEGRKAGVSEDVLDSDENLIAECEECNLGHGNRTLPLRMYIAILNARNARTE